MCTHTHIHTVEPHSAMKKNRFLLFAATGMDLEGILLSKISHRKTNTVWYHLHVESKNKQPTSEYNKKEADAQIQGTS